MKRLTPVGYLAQHGRAAASPPYAPVVEIYPYRGVPIEVAFSHSA